MPMDTPRLLPKLSPRVFVVDTIVAQSARRRAGPFRLGAAEEPWSSELSWRFSQAQLAMSNHGVCSFWKAPLSHLALLCFRKPQKISAQLI